LDTAYSTAFCATMRLRMDC